MTVKRPSGVKTPRADNERPQQPFSKVPAVQGSLPECRGRRASSWRRGPPRRSWRGPGSPGCTQASCPPLRWESPHRSGVSKFGQIKQGDHGGQRLGFCWLRFGCYTVCPILLGIVRFGQKWQSSWASWNIIAFLRVRCWSSRPTVTNDRQPTGMENQWPVGFRRPTTNDIWFLCYNISVYVSDHNGILIPHAMRGNEANFNNS